MVLRGRKTLGLGSSILMIIALVSVSADGQTRAQGPWWPSGTWGPNDEAGASNWITPAKILEAIRLVKTGKVYDLGHVYERGMSGVSGQRIYTMYLAGPIVPAGQNTFVYNEDFLCASIGQIGTQLDGLGHPGIRMKMADGTDQDVYYNGFTGPEISSFDGLRKLGIEHAKPIITRGILVDIPGYKGIDVLPNNYEVTVADVRGALKREGILEGSISPGDAIFFRYGLAKYWNERTRTPGGVPGIGLEVARWVVDRKASLVGSDSGGLEVTNSTNTYPVHQEIITKNGIYNHENLTFEELVTDKVYEFLYVFSPVPFKGATGSPGRPLAIH